jgi:hypothetical protein
MNSPQDNLFYFTLHKSQIPIIDQAIETAALIDREATA